MSLLKSILENLEEEEGRTASIGKASRRFVASSSRRLVVSSSRFRLVALLSFRRKGSLSFKRSYFFAFLRGAFYAPQPALQALLAMGSGEARY